MNLDVFSTNVATICKMRSGITDFFKLASEIQKEEESIRSLENHIATCNGMKTELDMERRNHAEELRQINQDINTLEDITKSTKSEIDRKRHVVTVALGEVDRMRNFINENLESMNILHKLEPSEEEMIFREARSLPIVTPQPQIPSDLPAFLQNFLINQANPNNQQLPATDQHPNLVNRHRMPPSFVEASKMKICENCGANIHRNAPTCPVCKMKTRSKNPKRKMKKAYQDAAF